MNEVDRLESLESETGALALTLADASGMTAAFVVQLRDMQGALGTTTRDLGQLERGFAGGLRHAFDGLLLDGLRLSDALRGVARSMAETVYGAAMRPVTDRLGGVLASGLNAAVSGLMPFADGAPFSQGRVMPFARGGVLSGPVSFPMRGGVTGLMGEAGPEAIMPLTRGADGRLGVRSQIGGGINVTMNVTTPDVQGFQRSQSQIAAQMARALSRGQRNR